MNNLTIHREWISELIVTAFNGNKASLSPIQEQHIKLLIRWYPQINQDGKDFYFFYSNCKKQNATAKARNELAKCENIRFSKEAFIELKEKNTPDLFPEHNPSVKQMFDILKTEQNLTANKIQEIFKSYRYEVIMLTSIQESRIREKKLSVSGTYIERLKAALDAENIDEQITTEREVKEYVTNGT